ncbi:hypothetical protein FHY55_17440 [Oceanicola sp. D3]|uniref:hypothetical protein n=1 Tax=Oceanicola sp. D3 TaxID=2587163 RepID=UPI00111F825E|nr:hypothetical protein [Oceanicola sp. D3]QDC10908.1 hypothetical protein FHY55_17440 [Oceanicola sp. D3]
MRSAQVWLTWASVATHALAACVLLALGLYLAATSGGSGGYALAALAFALAAVLAWLTRKELARARSAAPDALTPPRPAPAPPPSPNPATLAWLDARREVLRGYGVLSSTRLPEAIRNDPPEANILGLGDMVLRTAEGGDEPNLAVQREQVEMTEETYRRLLTDFADMLGRPAPDEIHLNPNRLSFRLDGTATQIEADFPSKYLAQEALAHSARLLERGAEGGRRLYRLPADMALVVTALTPQDAARLEAELRSQNHGLTPLAED